MRNKSVFLAVYTENAKLPAGKINRFASIRNKEFVLLVASWYFFLIIFFYWPLIAVIHFSWSPQGIIGY